MAKFKMACKNCGNIFEYYPYAKGRKKFCSRRCCNFFKIGKPKGKMSEETRAKCSKTFFKKGHTTNVGFKHSEETKRRLSEQRKGNNNPAWKGGKKIGGVGEYVYILMPNHPFAKKDGYIKEHRYIMEQHFGRYLKPEEVVHHINGDIKDNRIENLKLFSSNGKHTAHHHAQRRKNI